MVIVQGMNIPFSIQLIKSDTSFLTTATVSYIIYASDNIEQAVTTQTCAYDSITNNYFDELDVSSDWSDQSIGNYLLAWTIEDASGFATTQIENLTILPGLIDDTIDFTEAMRIILSAVAGKSTGFGTKEVYYRDAADSKNRITATLDRKGNRTNITLDGS